MRTSRARPRPSTTSLTGRASPSTFSRSALVLVDNRRAVGKNLRHQDSHVPGQSQLCSLHRLPPTPPMTLAQRLASSTVRSTANRDSPLPVPSDCAPRPSPHRSRRRHLLRGDRTNLYNFTASRTTASPAPPAPIPIEKEVTYRPRKPIPPGTTSRSRSTALGKGRRYEGGEPDTGAEPSTDGPRSQPALIGPLLDRAPAAPQPRGGDDHQRPNPPGTPSRPPICP
jgi:hypothetical protein